MQRNGGYFPSLAIIYDVEKLIGYISTKHYIK